MNKHIVTILLFILSLSARSQVKVLGGIITNGSGDAYPTHYDSLAYGGFRVVADTAERNDISIQRRKVGMLVFSISDTVTYQLYGGVTNSHWRMYYSNSVSNTETDPTIQAWIKNITESDISNWHYGYDHSLDSQSFSGATGMLTSVKTGAPAKSVSLDGRYLLIGDTANKWQPKGNYLTSYVESDPTINSWVKSVPQGTAANHYLGWGGESWVSRQINYNEIAGAPTISYPVTSVFGRTGNIVAQQSDYADFYSLTGHNHNVLSLTGFPSVTGNSGKYLSNDGAGLSWIPPPTPINTLSLTTPSVLYNSPVTFSNTNGAWTGALTFKTQNKGLVLATNATTDGLTPTLRALVQTDIPDLDANKITTGTIAAARLGSGTPSSSVVLYGNNTWAAPAVPIALDRVAVGTGPNITGWGGLQFTETSGASTLSIGNRNSGNIAWINFYSGSTYSGAIVANYGLNLLHAASQYAFVGSLTGSTGRMANYAGAAFTGSSTMDWNGNVRVSGAIYSAPNPLNTAKILAGYTASQNAASIQSIGPIWINPTTVDPVGANGMMNYVSTENAFKDFANGAWRTRVYADNVVFNQSALQNAQINTSSTITSRVYIAALSSSGAGRGVILYPSSTTSSGVSFGGNAGGYTGLRNGAAPGTLGICAFGPSTTSDTDLWTEYATFKYNATGLGSLQLNGYTAPSTLFTQTSTQTANTTGAMTLLGDGVGTKTIPANYPSVGRQIVIKFSGRASTGSTPGYVTITIKLGTEYIAVGTNYTLPANTVGIEVDGQVVLTYRTTGTTGTIVTTGGVNYTTGGVIASRSPLNNSGVPTTINTTVDNAVDVTATWSEAGNSVSIYNLSIDSKN